MEKEENKETADEEEALSFLEKDLGDLQPQDVLPPGDEKGEKILKELVRKLIENPGGEGSELRAKIVGKWIKGDSLFTLRDAYAGNHPENKVNQAHQLEQFMKMAVKMKIEGISTPESDKHLDVWLQTEEMLLCRVDKTVWLDPESV